MTNVHVQAVFDEVWEWGWDLGTLTIQSIHGRLEVSKCGVKQASCVVCKNLKVKFKLKLHNEKQRST